MFLQNIWQNLQSKCFLITARPARGENNKYGFRNQTRNHPLKELLVAATNAFKVLVQKYVRVKCGIITLDVIRYLLAWPCFT